MFFGNNNNKRSSKSIKKHRILSALNLKMHRLGHYVHHEHCVCRLEPYCWDDVFEKGVSNYKRKLKLKYEEKTYLFQHDEADAAHSLSQIIPGQTVTVQRRQKVPEATPAYFSSSAKAEDHLYAQVWRRWSEQWSLLVLIFQRIVAVECNVFNAHFLNRKLLQNIELNNQLSRYCIDRHYTILDDSSSMKTQG